MARAFTAVLVMSCLAASAQAGEPFKAPWSGGSNSAEASPFAMPHAPPASAVERGSGTRIFAGTALLPNAVLGLGLLGERAGSGPLAPVTAREIDRPRQRKAAVGFSLRF